MKTNRTKLTTYLTLADIAHEINVGIDSMRTYHQRASRNRRANTSRPGDLPAPDETFGRSPVWNEETINEWIANRPGRGAGGGRPPRRA